MPCGTVAPRFAAATACAHVWAPEHVIVEQARGLEYTDGSCSGCLSHLRVVWRLRASFGSCFRHTFYHSSKLEARSKARRIVEHLTFCGSDSFQRRAAPLLSPGSTTSCLWRPRRRRNYYYYYTYYYYYYYYYYYLMICMYEHIHIYIYIHNTHVCVYMYNPHLGLINAPPLFCFPSNYLFHYSFTIKKARSILNSGQDFINTFLRHGRYQLGHLGGHPFSLKARPPNK